MVERRRQTGRRRNDSLTDSNIGDEFDRLEETTMSLTDRLHSLENKLDANSKATQRSVELLEGLSSVIRAGVIVAKLGGWLSPIIAAVLVVKTFFWGTK